MKREDAILLAQLAKSLKEVTDKLEKEYLDGNADGFNKSKKLFFQIQEEIDGMTNE